MGKERLFPDYIFESSWEVCNKVGGIYTVLSTRAKTLKEKLQDQLIFIVLIVGGTRLILISQVIMRFMPIGKSRQPKKGCKLKWVAGIFLVSLLQY